MNREATLEQLRTLKLQGMARSYEAVLSLPVQSQPGAHELLAQLVQHEIENKRSKRTDLYLRLSKLRYASMLEEIKCSTERNLTREQVSSLADCSWIERAENLLVIGATGCGKSFLACGLGHQACQLGYKTLYLNMNRFIEKVTLAKLDGTFIKLLNQIEKTSLLILDDFGLQPLSADNRLALLQILEDRYKRKATLIASQLPVLKWHEYLGDPTLADAILDRLTANAQRIDLKGKSLRHDK
ncbi:MAG: ATP-binding protein [Cyclobacteriaceae bacterium]|nr:ATP-binding protein [Cyclobacteriaceae bacterium]